MIVFPKESESSFLQNPYSCLVHSRDGIAHDRREAVVDSVAGYRWHLAWAHKTWQQQRWNWSKRIVGWSKKHVVVE